MEPKQQDKQGAVFDWGLLGKSLVDADITNSDTPWTLRQLTKGHGNRLTRAAQRAMASGLARVHTRVNGARVYVLTPEGASSLAAWAATPTFARFPWDALGYGLLAMGIPEPGTAWTLARVMDTVGKRPQRANVAVSRAHAAGLVARVGARWSSAKWTLTSAGHAGLHAWATRVTGTEGAPKKDKKASVLPSTSPMPPELADLLLTLPSPKRAHHTLLCAVERLATKHGPAWNGVFSAPDLENKALSGILHSKALAAQAFRLARGGVHAEADPLRVHYALRADACLETTAPTWTVEDFARSVPEPTRRYVTALAGMPATSPTYEGRMAFLEQYGTITTSEARPMGLTQKMRFPHLDKVTDLGHQCLAVWQAEGAGGDGAEVDPAAPADPPAYTPEVDDWIVDAEARDNAYRKHAKTSGFVWPDTSPDVVPIPAPEPVRLGIGARLDTRDPTTLMAVARVVETVGEGIGVRGARRVARHLRTVAATLEWVAEDDAAGGEDDRSGTHDS